MSALAWLLLGAAFVMVAVGGLMTAIEAAMIAMPRAGLVRLAERARARRSLLAIAGDIGAHLNAVIFVRVLTETGAAALVTLALFDLLQNIGWVFLWTAVIMTVVSFVLVGASPRAAGRSHAPVVLRWTAPLARFVRVLIGPLASLFVAIGSRVSPGRVRGVSSEAHLLSLVDEATEEAVLEEDDRELIHSVLQFNDTTVRAVMVPRPDMVTVGMDDSVDEALAMFLDAGFSRVPVETGTAEDIVGVLYLRDVVRAKVHGSEVPLRIESLVRPARFVPDSMKVDALLAQMRQESTHLAVVVDEYGGIAGLVTMEDLLEELVGDISDEYDRDAPQIMALPDGFFRVNARVPVDEFGALFGITLVDDDVDTVGGWFLKVMGRVPHAGDRVRRDGIVVECERVEHRRRIVSVLAWAVSPAQGAAHD